MNIFDYQRAIMDDASVTRAQQDVLLALTSWVSGKGPWWKVWPKNDEICARSKLKERAFKKALKELDGVWFTRSQEDGRRVFTLHTPEQCSKCTVQQMHSAANAPPPVQQMHSPPCSKCTPPRAANAPPSYIRKEDTNEDTREETKEETRQQQHAPEITREPQAGVGGVVVSPVSGQASTAHIPFGAPDHAGRPLVPTQNRLPRQQLTRWWHEGTGKPCPLSWAVTEHILTHWSALEVTEAAQGAMIANNPAAYFLASLANMAKEPALEQEPAHEPAQVLPHAPGHGEEEAGPQEWVDRKRILADMAAMGLGPDPAPEPAPEPEPAPAQIPELLPAEPEQESQECVIDKAAWMEMRKKLRNRRDPITGITQLNTQALFDFDKQHRARQAAMRATQEAAP